MNKIAGMSRLDWKRSIELANNSAYIGHERKRKGTGTVYVFSATEGSAEGILRDAQKKYRGNEVVMNVRKRMGYGNEYEIYVLIPKEAALEQPLSMRRDYGQAESGSMLNELERMQESDRNATVRALAKMAKAVLAKKPVPPAFIAELTGMGFRDDGDREYILRNRHAGYGDKEPDCDGDEDGRYEDCMDSFYEDGEWEFDEWADPIIKKVEKLARKSRVKVEFDTSAEYGMITVTVK